MKFIIWDPKDGEPRRGDDGSFQTDGLIGRVSEDNVYIKTYAKYEEREINVLSMEVGQFVPAAFNLSGGKGVYRVYRVE